MSLAFRAAGFAALVAVSAGVFAAPARAENGRNGALLGGVAAGLVGGVLLDRALQGGRPQPTYDPQPTYSVPRPVRVVEDPYIPRMSSLKAACDDGDTNACIRFGIIIGQHKERESQWRRQHPDMFAWDRR